MQLQLFNHSDNHGISYLQASQLRETAATPAAAAADGATSVAEGMEGFVQLGRVKVTRHHTPAQGPFQQHQAQLAGLDLQATGTSGLQ